MSWSLRCFRSAYLIALLIAKLICLTAAFATVYTVVQATNVAAGGSPTAVSPDEYQRAVQLENALHYIPPNDSELAVRSVALLMAQRLVANRTNRSSCGCVDGAGTVEVRSSLFADACHLPDMASLRGLLRLAWAAADGSLRLCCSATSPDDLSKAVQEASERAVFSFLDISAAVASAFMRSEAKYFHPQSLLDAHSAVLGTSVTFRTRTFF